MASRDLLVYPTIKDRIIQMATKLIIEPIAMNIYFSFLTIASGSQSVARDY